MIVKFKKSEQPKLLDFPSAMAQDQTPLQGEASVAKEKRKSGKSWILRAVLFVAVLAIVGIVAITLVLSQGPISNEQLRAGLETQLSQLLGENYQAKIGNANVALGERGLISLKAADVKFLDKQDTNLGVVNDVSVQLKALPFLSGQVKAESLSLNKASVSILPYFGSPIGKATQASDLWSAKVDLSTGLKSLGDALRQAESSIASAGLDSIVLKDTAILGFEAFGLRSRRATATRFEIKHNANFQSGLQFKGLMETEHSNWVFSGSWLTEETTSILEIQISGLKFRDFLFLPDQTEPGKFDMDGDFVLTLKAPFSSDKKPQQAFGQIAIGQSSLNMGKDHASTIAKAILNFRIHPQGNRITLEKSPFIFPTAKSVLVGNIDFANSATVDPVFTIQASDIVSYAMLPSEAAAEGGLLAQGKLNRQNKSFDFEKLEVKTKQGHISGNGSVAFSEQATPNIKLDLISDRMRVSDFKQIWPLFLAPKVREWAKDGLLGGEIRSAKVKVDFPLSIIRDQIPFSNRHVQATIKVAGVSIKTAGELPRLINANGEVRYQGVETKVLLNDATAKVVGYPSLKVTSGQFIVPNYKSKPLLADLSFDVASSASSLATITSKAPLNVKPIAGLEPSNVAGSVTSTVKTQLVLLPENKIKTQSWSVKSSVRNGSSRKKIADRSISAANIEVALSSSSAVADVKGNAKIDGVQADIALLQPLDGSAAKNSVTMQLDDTARKKLGINTGDVIKGPIAVSIGSQKNGGTSITVDLKNATLSFPWIGWSKGKGVSATASFAMYDKNGVTELRDIRLKGKGFSAGGSIVADKSGLRSAKLKNVKLNKTDDLDLRLARTKSGYDVVVNARSYDVRAIIKSSLNNQRVSGGKGLRVNVKGSVRRLLGFNGQILSGVSIDLSQRGNVVNRANLKAVAAGDAPTIFAVAPANGGLQTTIKTQNAGSVLAFLNLYSKLSGGSMNALLTTDKSGISRGTIQARNFKLLNEPRLAALLKAPQNNVAGLDGDKVRSVLRSVPTKNAGVDSLLAEVIKKPGNLRITRGRLSGGDASAAFEGTVYDRNNRMKINGTFLPGRALNTFVSKIPLIGLAFGNGKTSGLLGITFQLRGAYNNPQIRVNPLSIVAPGVFRKLFKF